MSLLSVSQLKDPICFGIFTGKSRPGAGAGAGAAGALAAAGASAGAGVGSGGSTHHAEHK